jgi:hypothetical protein
MFPLTGRYYKIAAIVFITICGIFVATLNADGQTKKTFNKTPQSKDTTFIPNGNGKDSIPELPSNEVAAQTETDSSELFIPLYKHGSMFMTGGQYYKKITKKDLLWEDYFGLYDVLANNLPAYPLYQGAYYLYNQLSMFGTGHRSFAFRFNNRPINDANFGAFNIDMFPTEFMESAEILLGSDAVIFSNNSTGALINIQEVRYNAATPYTKLWLSQAGATMITSDGIFSQNVLPNVNVTVGFRAITSKGDFDNQWVDSWNLRGIVRWNLSSLTNISLSETFYNHAMGTNGGVNPETSLNMYNPREADVLYDSFNDRLIRHDVNLTLSSYLAEDSTSAISLTGFFTYADYYQRVPGIVLETDSIMHNDVLSNQMGVTGKYEQEISDFLSLKVGGDLLFSVVDKALFNDEMKGLSLGGFGHIAFHPVNNLIISGGIRISSQLERFYNSLGGKIQYFYNPESSIFGDISFSQRVPSPAEGLNLRNENHFLILGGAKLKKNVSELEGSIFLRNVTNPITAETVTDADGNIINTVSVQKEALTATGLGLTFSSLLFDNLHYLLSGNLTFDNWATVAGFSNPRLNGRFKIYYRIALGRSEVRFGVDMNAVYQKSWLRFFPQHRQYTLIEDNPLSQFGGINIFAHAKLGNAYVKLNLRNILSNEYYFVAYYPKSNLYFNLTVNWAFLD